LTIILIYRTVIFNKLKELNTQKERTLTIIAIAAAIGVIGVLVVVETFVIPLQQQQQAEAAGRGFPGCANTPGANASRLRCIH